MRHIQHVWRNDITGLRAIAVLPVLLFHAFPALLPGGFFGVDVFFVISGYLISGIIFRSLRDDKFSYRIFYEKRIKRILPNLILLLIAVSIVGYFYLIPEEYKKLGHHVYSSAVFLQNFRLLKSVGYFTEEALRQPLLHLWSLAIEEQFYIVFPILCSIIWKFSHRSIKTLGIFVFFITIGSFSACLLAHDKNFSFYFPLTRFWELGVGILLAYNETFEGRGQNQKFAPGFRHGLSIAGLLCIVIPMLFYTESLAHPGMLTLLPVLGATSIIAARPSAIINRTVLSWRPVTFVGLISYSLYLWHWPILSFLYICIPNLTYKSVLLALIASFVVASLIYFFVENPIRRSKLNSTSVSLVLLLALVAVYACGKQIKNQEGLPDRNFSGALSYVTNAFDWIPKLNLPTLEHSSLSQLRVIEATDFPPVVFAGDSHIEQYYLRSMSLSKHWKINTGYLMKGGLFFFNPKLSESSSKSKLKFAEDFAKLADQNGLKTLVIAQKWGGYSQIPGFYEAISAFLEKIKNRQNLRIYIILDAPWNEGETPDEQGSFCPLKHLDRLSESIDPEDFVVSFPENDKWKKGNKAARKAFGDRVIYIDPTPYVCPGGKCNLLRWYKDDDHLQPRRIETDGIWIDRIYEETKKRLEAENN